MRQILLVAILIIFSALQLGCASINAYLKNAVGEGGPKEEPQVAKFSDGDMPPKVRRQYKRTTKESLADESALDQKSGSLWVMEGQGAYLFSQNVVRLVGDPLAVTLEGDPKEQLQSKVNVIKKLLAKIEERQAARMRGPASDKGEGADDAKPAKADKAPAKTAAADAKDKPEEGGDLGVKIVPTRIMERTLEGNYRVKGSQPIMIGTREYKINLTGIVRAEDFNEEGISAAKLLDPKFDIVSARKVGEM